MKTSTNFRTWSNITKSKKHETVGQSFIHAAGDGFTQGSRGNRNTYKFPQIICRYHRTSTVNILLHFLLYSTQWPFLTQCKHFNLPSAEPFQLFLLMFIFLNVQTGENCWRFSTSEWRACIEIKGKNEACCCSMEPNKQATYLRNVSRRSVLLTFI